MTPEKKVQFIERVDKSILGLKGLQIVVYCDRNRRGDLSKEEKQKCTFLQIGNEVLSKINGEYIKKKYNIKNGVEFGNKLHEERVKYIKSVSFGDSPQNLTLFLQQLHPFHLHQKFPF